MGAAVGSGLTGSRAGGIGGAGTCATPLVGVTALLCTDSGLGPTGLIAMTVKVYVTPSVRPEKMAAVVAATVRVATALAPAYAVSL